MMCVSRFKITRHSKGDDDSLYAVVMSAKLPQAIGIFILSCYFITYGISVTAWLIAGMLSWALIVHLMLAITLEMPEDAQSRLSYGVVCLSLMLLGSLQVLGLMINWMVDGRYLAGLIALTIFASVWFLWFKGSVEIAKRFSTSSSSKQLDID